MRVIQLGALRSHDVRLSARESVAILHEVCRQSHAHAQAGHWFPAPQLADLSLSEAGEIVINPSAIATSRPSSDSLKNLIDELLPTDVSDASFPAPKPGDPCPLPAAGGDDRVVLRALFARACALGFLPWLYGERMISTTVAPLPEFQFFDAPPVDDSQPAVATRPDVSPAPDVSPELELRPVPDVSPMRSAPRVARANAGWVRRAALWGLAVNAVLGIAIVWPLVSLPRLQGLLARATGETTAETGFDPPSAPAARASTTSPQDAAGRAPRPDVSTALLRDSDAGSRPVGVVLSLAASRPIAGLIPSAGNVSVPGVDDADDATVSPDGQLVAFVSDRDGERGVFVAHRDGQNVTRASGEGRASAPAWSPDAQRLAFVRAETDRPTVWNLWMRNMRTGELAQLTSHDKGIVRGASWFPDGRRLCYGQGSRLLVLDVGSRRARPVSSPVTGGAIRTASVSPDGERIAFDVEGDGIWLLDVARGSMERVAEEPAASGLTWAPTGNRLLYYSLHAREWRAWQRAPAS
jgi:hypothetical protein